MHTQLFHKLRQEVGSERIQRSFGETPTFSPAKVIMRAKLMGIELSDARKQELVFSEYLQLMIHEICEDEYYSDLTFYEKMRFAYSISNGFSVNEISEYLRGPQIREDFREKLKKAVDVAKNRDIA
ncbi:MAG: hypothetical protein ACXWLH_06490 [Candidatus Saccharimonadales bacterium]